MSYSIMIRGLDTIQRALGVDISPALRTATKGIAGAIHDKLSPYPPATIANSPAEPKWYERGFGPRWRTKKGEVHGRKTSEMLNRSWAIEPVGTMGHRVSSAASYAPYVHSAEKQSSVMKRIGWKTDDWAIRQVVDSGKAKEIVLRALAHLLHLGR